jgi:predicted transcriptional regulator of viral defense system
MVPWNVVKFSDNSEKRTALIFSRQSQQQSLCLAYASALKMEALLPSIPSVIYQNTRFHIQETELAGLKIML